MDSVWAPSETTETLFQNGTVTDSIKKVFRLLFWLAYALTLESRLSYKKPAWLYIVKNNFLFQYCATIDKQLLYSFELCASKSNHYFL